MEGQDSGRQIDGDILQGKADILRAQREGLGMNGPNQSDTSPRSLGEGDKPLPAALRPLGTPVGGDRESLSEENQAEDEDLTRRIQVALEETARQMPVGPERPQPETEQQEGPIPQLDLADQILAEQRRAVARRRQRPGMAPVAVAGWRGIGRVVETIRGDRTSATLSTPVRAPAENPEPTGPWDSEIARIVAADITRLYGRG